MKPLEEIQAYFREDRFCNGLGIVVESVAEDSAVCSVQVLPEHCNALGRAQGGFLFTLADFTFAVAANHEVSGTVTLESQISYFSAPRGDLLRARAQCVHKGCTVSRYRVDITDEEGRLVAQAGCTGYHTTAG